jgi:hypothetical protein
MEKQTEEFKIEKNVEMLMKHEHHSKYPFDKMEIGDSFSFPIETWQKVAGCASYRKKTTPKRFRVSLTGLRCWRTK